MVEVEHDRTEESSVVHESLASGQDGVRLSLGYTGSLSGDMGERRDALAGVLRDIVETLDGLDEAEVDWSNLSVSGQTVQLVVPVEQVPVVEADAASKGVRVALVEVQQIV